MRKLSKVLVLILCSMVSGLATAETCTAMFAEPKGTFGFQIIPDLKVSQLDPESPFPNLDSYHEGTVVSILCKRNTIVPLEIDYVVLDAGYKMWTSDGETIFQVFLHEDEYIGKLLRGPEPDAETILKIGDKLDYYNVRKDEPNDTKPPSE